VIHSFSFNLISFDKIKSKLVNDNYPVRQAYNLILQIFFLKFILSKNFKLNLHKTFSFSLNADYNANISAYFEYAHNKFLEWGLSVKKYIIKKYFLYCFCICQSRISTISGKNAYFCHLDITYTLLQKVLYVFRFARKLTSTSNLNYNF